MKSKSPYSRVPESNSSSATTTFARLRSLFQRRAFALLSAVALVLTGCGDDSATGEIVSPDEMGKLLNKSLPKGTAIESAKDFMIKEGFSCEPKLDAVWKRKPHINYLLCKREDGSPPIKRLWEAAVIHDGTNVLAVDLRSALIYP